MKSEDYLREIDAAGRELSARARVLSAAANPVTLVRASISRDWKWWLPAAAAAGFVAARILRAPSSGGAKGSSSPASSSSYWIPVVIKLLPAVTSQLVPLILSLRSRREP